MTIENSLKYLLRFMITLFTLISLIEPAQAQLTQSFDLTPPTNSQLSCPAYRQSTNYTCGPAAVMALLHYYGKLDSRDMNAATEMRIANEMGTSACAGTPPEQVVDWLEKHGFHAELGHKVSSDILQQNINRGIPTLVVIEHHWTLASGYKSANQKDYIIFTDSCQQKIILNSAYIDSLWLKPLCRGTHCNGNVGDYIVAQPSS